MYLVLSVAVYIDDKDCEDGGERSALPSNENCCIRAADDLSCHRVKILANHTSLTPKRQILKPCLGHLSFGDKGAKLRAATTDSKYEICCLGHGYQNCGVPQPQGVHLFGASLSINHLFSSLADH